MKLSFPRKAVFWESELRIDIIYFICVYTVINKYICIYICTQIHIYNKNNV